MSFCNIFCQRAYQSPLAQDVDSCSAVGICFDESGATETAQPADSLDFANKSSQLQELRAAAAMRRQQQHEPSRLPLSSPAGSDYDAACLASLRSAASSRRSQQSRTSTSLYMRAPRANNTTLRGHTQRQMNKNMIST